MHRTVEGHEEQGSAAPSCLRTASRHARRPSRRSVSPRTGPFGPLTYQNDNVLLDRLGPEGVGRITLFQTTASRFTNVQDKSALYSYEILNFVDGHRSITEIRNAVAAEFGPIPTPTVANLSTPANRPASSPTPTSP